LALPRTGRLQVASGVNGYKLHGLVFTGSIVARGIDMGKAYFHVLYEFTMEPSSLPT